MSLSIMRRAMPRRVGGAQRRPTRVRMRALRGDVVSLPRYVSAFEVAATLGVSYHKALRVMREAGAIKIGALVRIEETRLRSYLDQCPELARPVCSSAPVARAGTTPSTRRSAMSASARQTTTRPGDDLPRCSSAAEFARWRPARAR